MKGLGDAQMRVLVAYYSETGNTEKVARAIYDEVSMNHSADLKKVAEVTIDTLSSYNLVFLGSACHSSDLASPVQRILNAIPDSPKFKLAGFFTHATSSGGFEKWASKCVSSFQEISKEKKIDFKGYFNCQGAPSPPIQEFIRREVNIPAGQREAYFEEVRKHPTTEDLHKARDFARSILSQLD